MREEELETNESEGVDFLDELLKLSGWSQVNDEETERTSLDYGLDEGLKYCVQHSLSFLLNIVELCDQQVHS